jgi:hypothetical protein
MLCVICSSTIIYLLLTLTGLLKPGKICLEPTIQIAQHFELRIRSTVPIVTVLINLSSC